MCSSKVMSGALLSSHTPFLQSLLLSDPHQKKLFPLVSAVRRLHHPFILSWAHSHPYPPMAIISNFFLSWTHHLALDLHIPRLVFSPSGTFALSLYFSLWHHLPVNPNPPSNAASLITFPDLPNSPVYLVDESLTSTNS